MNNDRLSLIGLRIKELRREKQMNLRELAKRSGLSPGLISKIENFRTIPSLSVLIEIANALEVDFSVLVKNINAEDQSPYLLVRRGEGKLEEREDSQNLTYHFLLSQNIADHIIRVNVVTVQPESYRKPLSTNALELVHVLEGEAVYGFKGEQVTLRKGDTLYFDGLAPHSVQNLSTQPAVLYKVYFIRQTEQ